MATTLYLTNIPADFQYDTTETGGTRTRLFKLSTERGTSATYETAQQITQANIDPATADWATDLTYFRYSGDKSYIGWVTDPLKTSVHISSFMAAVFYGIESDVLAKAKLGVAVIVIDRNGNPASYGNSSTIQYGEDDAEMGTTIGALSFTLSRYKLNKLVEVGERIMIVPYAVDAATPMVAGYTLSFYYGGSSAYNGSTIADPYVTFQESLEFIDFVSLNPDNPSDNIITLGGVQFKTTGPVRVNMSSAYPGKISQGDYGRNDNARISTFSVSDLTGGHGVWKYRTQGGFLQDGDRYWTGKNIDPWPGALILGPKINTSTLSGNPQPYTINEVWLGAFPANYIFITGSSPGYYYSANGTTFTLVTNSTTTAIGSILQVVQTGRGTLALRGSSSFGAVTGLSAADIVANTGGTVRPYTTMTVYDEFIYFLSTDTDTATSTGRLYRLSSDLSGYSGASPALVSTYTDNVFSVLSPTKNIELYTYEDASGFPAIWALSAGGAAVHSPDDRTWYKAKFDILPFKKTFDLGMTSAASSFQTLGRLWKESLVYQTGRLTLNKLTMSNGQLLVEDMGFIGQDGIASDAVNTANYDGEILQMCSDQEHFFASVSGGTGALFMTRGRGWHPLYSGNTITAMGTGSINGAKLYFNAGASLNWIDIAKLDRAPYASSSISKEYTASGMVVLPYFDGGYEAQSKLALRLRVKIKSQTKGQTVGIQYRLNGSTAGWETLSDTSDTSIADVLSSTGEHILRFGRRNEGLFFNSIQFRINLETNDENYSPIVEYIEFEYLREPEVEKGFVINIDMSSEVGGLTPQQQEDMLWMMIKRKELVMFSYKPEVGTWNSTNYTYDGMVQRSTLVKVVQPDGVSRIGADERGQWAVYLVEMNKPVLTQP